MKVGIFSDAHGNPLVFNSVLEEMASRGVDRYVFLGDALGYFPEFKPILQTLRRVQAVCVRGNHEDVVLGNSILLPERDSVMKVTDTRMLLSGEDRDWLSRWPDQHTLRWGGRILKFYHGSPADPLNGRLLPETDLEQFASIEADLLAVGHTHRPFHGKIGTTVVVNVGSCGYPRHGDRVATAVVADMDSLSVEWIRVPVDLDRLIQRYGEGVDQRVWDTLRKLPVPMKTP